ncbi:MAG: hypothetical protein PHF97_12790 [Bacteroidales bacterium]|nr:hypothetical protein [Bacteroidales bacterium]
MKKTTLSELQGGRNPGFWSALITLAIIIWYLVAFGLYQPILHAPWNGIEPYVASFKPAPFFSWIIPCFLLTISYLVLIVCVYHVSCGENKIWSLLTLIFAIAYSIISSTNYYIQMTVVEYNVAHKSLEGLSLLLFAHPYPHSIPGALEGIGYGFMSLSFLSAAFIFRKKNNERWLRWSFTGAGLTGIFVFTDPIYSLPLKIIIVIAIANGVFLLLSMTFLSIWFKSGRFKVE